MQDDAPRWNDRYAATTPAVARAPEVFERWPDLVALLPASARCVDIASGPGAVTLWLALRGFDVTALDVSDVAIGLLEAAAHSSGVSARVDARTVDLDRGLPADIVDLDLVVCQRFRDVALYRPMVDHLRSGGLAVVTVLSSVGNDHPGPFHARAGELPNAFGADARCDVLHQFEGDGVAHIAVRRR